MLILFVTLVMSLCGFQTFFITERLNAINRIVVFTPKELFEASIPLIQEINDEPIIHFDRTLLRNYLSTYYDSTLRPYTISYSFSLFFYNQEDGSYCKGLYCQAVKVNVNCEVTRLTDYQRSISYYIRKN